MKQCELSENPHLFLALVDRLCFVSIFCVNELSGARPWAKNSFLQLWEVSC
ncbi:hypothetical protein SAMN02745702_01132 [Desulfobaculum bizertense DSM 18034]|uniref:Uncharacterized protein n=1 Tax=Desulfobaculum bizertense DSM 18034 TaxID=1121442 RepID=A0A1T4VWT1_9BACT|nr:hypothetical protein SAMN02745702_01132 [Desulfobaculum bizertense DSM 18034]